MGAAEKKQRLQRKHLESGYTGPTKAGRRGITGVIQSALHDKPIPIFRVRTLADMTPEERAAIEERHGAKIKGFENAR